MQNGFENNADQYIDYSQSICYDFASDMIIKATLSAYLFINIFRNVTREYKRINIP